MASGKTLNAANLQVLGAAQLSELLIEISRGNGAAQRRLRLALAGSAGAGEAARAVTKRLTSIAGAKTWLDWQKIKPFVADLQAQRRAVLDLVAPGDPREAFELMWRLVGCAGPVLARSEDGGGRLRDAFQEAARDLGPLAQRAGSPPEELADRAFRVLCAEEWGAWDELVPILAPQLGVAGLERLRGLLRAGADQPRTRVILRQVADALGDVDGFIEQFDKRARATPAVAATVARRLLDAKRPQEAWAALEAVEARQRHHAPPEWEQARVDTLEALGRGEEAQAFRWQRFLETLDATHLRAHLRKLPDFDDFEAEQRALAHASAFADVHKALAFLLAWPDLHRASALVLERSQKLDGDLYELLSPAADALDAKYPLAATVLRRAMIGFVLRVGRSSRFKHAARHLVACRDAAARVAAFGTLPDHPAYERALRGTHGRKAGFWDEVAALG